MPMADSGVRKAGLPESAMGILASAQMARHYNLPFRGGGALTSSKAPDAQAAYESMMCMWPTILDRVNFVLHAAGWLESALLASNEKFIIDGEALRMFEWILGHGIPVDAEGLAMDALREVGPGGHFLGAEHTLRNYRTGFYRPWISSTENFDRWNRFGARTADVVAAEKWKQVLAEYPDPGIDPGVDEQLKEFMEKRRREIGADLFIGSEPSPPELPAGKDRLPGTRSCERLGVCGRCSVRCSTGREVSEVVAKAMGWRSGCARTGSRSAAGKLRAHRRGRSGVPGVRRRGAFAT